MQLVATIVYYVLEIFWFCLIARIIVEMIRSFARDWRPHGVLVVLLEIVFSVTDPPVRLLRRVIPPLRLGSVSIDLSILLLFILIGILIQVSLRLGAVPVSIMSLFGN